MFIGKLRFIPSRILLIMILPSLLTACATLELFGISDKPAWDYLTKGWEEDRATVYFDSTVTKDDAANLAQWRHERNKSSDRKNNSHWLLHIVDDSFRIENLNSSSNAPTSEQMASLKNFACTISEDVFNNASVVYRIHHYSGSGYSQGEFPSLIIGAASPPLVDVHCGDGIVKAVNQKSATGNLASTTKPESEETTSWTRETLYTKFLIPDDFPDGWQVQRSQDNLTIEGTHTEFMTAKKIDMDFEIHDTSTAARQSFEQRKADAQSTIDARGISGDKLEDVKHDAPIFVWMSKGNKDYGSDSWEAYGLTGNVVFRVYNYGSLRAPSKGFASKIAKKQMDKLTD